MKRILYMFIFPGFNPVDSLVLPPGEPDIAREILKQRLGQAASEFVDGW